MHIDASGSDFNKFQRIGVCCAVSIVFFSFSVFRILLLSFSCSFPLFLSCSCGFSYIIYVLLLGCVLCLCSHMLQYFIVVSCCYVSVFIVCYFCLCVFALGACMMLYYGLFQGVLDYISKCDPIFSYHAFSLYHVLPLSLSLSFSLSLSLSHSLSLSWFLLNRCFMNLAL